MAHTECLVHNYVISHSTCLYICNMDYFSIKMSFCSAVWCLRDPPSYRWQRDSWRGGGWSHWYCLVSSGGPRPPPGSPSPRTLASPGWWSQRWRAPVSLPPSPRESPPLSAYPQQALCTALLRQQFSFHIYCYILLVGPHWCLWRTDSPVRGTVLLGRTACGGARRKI